MTGKRMRANPFTYTLLALILAGCSSLGHRGDRASLDVEVVALELSRAQGAGITAIPVKLVLVNDSHIDLTVDLFSLGASLGALRLWSPNGLDEWSMPSLDPGELVTPAEASRAIGAGQRVQIEVAKLASNNRLRLTNAHLIPLERRPPTPTKLRYDLEVMIHCKAGGRQISLPLTGAGELEVR